MPAVTAETLTLPRLTRMECSTCSALVTEPEAWWRRSCSLSPRQQTDESVDLRPLVGRARLAERRKLIQTSRTSCSLIGRPSQTRPDDGREPHFVPIASHRVHASLAGNNARNPRHLEDLLACLSPASNVASNVGTSKQSTFSNAGHLAWFILDVVDQPDLAPSTGPTATTTTPPTTPRPCWACCCTATASACAPPVSSNDAATRTSPSACWPPTRPRPCHHRPLPRPPRTGPAGFLTLAADHSGGGAWARQPGDQARRWQRDGRPGGADRSARRAQLLRLAGRVRARRAGRRAAVGASLVGRIGADHELLRMAAVVEEAARSTARPALRA